MHPYFCSFYDADRNTFYRTGVIPSVANPGALHEAWSSYLAKTYHVPRATLAYCNRAQADVAGQQYTLTSMDERAKLAKGVMVVVDLKYTPDQTGPAAQATPAAPAAGSTAQTTSAPQGQITSVEQIPEPFRKAALAEVPNSKAYCLNHEIIAGLVDCDCFSKIVLDYRIAHAKEYHGSVESRSGDWLPLTNLMLGPLNCSECISDERVTNWVAARTLKSLAPNYPAADKQFLTACVSRSFLASFRAKPNLGLERDFFIQAMESCSKQLRH